MSDRLPVRKTYKLFVGGAFPRSESGRTLEVEGYNVARASRKDARDAVVAARKAVAGWSGATAYNRGQVLYRIAELLEGRRAQFVDDLGDELRPAALEELGDPVEHLAAVVRGGPRPVSYTHLTLPTICSV